MNPIRFNPALGSIEGVALTERRLSDMKDVFADQSAYMRALSIGDALLYTVASVEPAQGDGDLHYGLGAVQPGRIGGEYYMTKGHLHTWRDAAEVYIGLSGEGAMLLEDERSGQSRLIPLLPDSIVYVPGNTAHRTLNTGTVPLTYLGVYPAKAGHDYGAIAARNFRMVVVAGDDGKPVMIEREQYLGR